MLPSHRDVECIQNKKHCLKHLTNTFRKGEFTTQCFFVTCKHALANLHTHIHV